MVMVVVVVERKCGWQVQLIFRQGLLPRFVPSAELFSGAVAKAFALLQLGLTIDGSCATTAAVV
jgi:hypothetical protein